MRRQDRQMPEAFAWQVVDSCPYATLATVNQDGTPYCVPVSIARREKTLYFHCAAQGQKSENLVRQPWACISCVSWVHVPEGKFTTEYASAIAQGPCAEVTDREEKIQALRLICQRYAPGNMGAFDEAIAGSLDRTAVWKVEAEQVTGKRKQYDSQGKEMKFGRME